MHRSNKECISVNKQITYNLNKSVNNSKSIVVLLHQNRCCGYHSKEWVRKLEDLTVLKRSPDLLSNVKIGQDQLRLIIKHILFYGGCGHFGQVT